VNGRKYQRRVESRMLLTTSFAMIWRWRTHVAANMRLRGLYILLDGQPVRSCLMLAVQAKNHEVSTVEGLADKDGEYHPLQQRCMIITACNAATARPHLDDHDGISR